jgi:hypothetical protein
MQTAHMATATTAIYSHVSALELRSSGPLAHVENITFGLSDMQMGWDRSDVRSIEKITAQECCFGCADQNSEQAN